MSIPAFSLCLCPNSLFLLRWVPSTRKFSSVGTNIFSTATFCAQKCSFFSDGYPFQENSLPWSQISSDPILFVPRNATFPQMGTVSSKTFSLNPLKHSSNGDLYHPPIKISFNICVALPHTFSISATRSTPKKPRSSSFSHNVCGRIVIFMWHCHITQIKRHHEDPLPPVNFSSVNPMLTQTHGEFSIAAEVWTRLCAE